MQYLSILMCMFWSEYILVSIYSDQNMVAKMLYIISRNLLGPNAYFLLRLVTLGKLEMLTNRNKKVSLFFLKFSTEVVFNRGI